MIKVNKSPLSKNTSVLFVTFSRWENKKRTPTNGSLDPLRDYLVPKIRKLVIIDQPHPGSDIVMPVIEEFKNNSFKFVPHMPSSYIYLLKPFLDMSSTTNTQIRFKVRDFLSVIDWGLKDKTKFDYFIGLESINAIAAIFLRKIGKVKKVVYYVSDYSPNRYQSKWFNMLYLKLDRFCATHADFIWDVSKAMQPARIQAGLSADKSAPVIHVPNGLLPEQIKVNPISKIEKHSLVYMGTLGGENGPDIAIKCLIYVRKQFPGVKLHIVGGTNKDFLWLKKIIKKNNLDNNVIFDGFIPDSVEMSKIIRSCAIGLAPYRDFEGSIRKYADAGKIRAYCASGIPTISSQIPPLGQEVAKKGAAIIANDDPKSFAKAIIDIFKDPKLYLKLRRNAIILAKHNTWDNSFNRAFEVM